MGGTPKRVEQFAYYIMQEIGHKLPAGTTLLDISQYSYRYSMYKVGPVLSISVSKIGRVLYIIHEVFQSVAVYLDRWCFVSRSTAWASRPWASCCMR